MFQENAHASDWYHFVPYALAAFWQMPLLNLPASPFFLVYGQDVMTPAEIAMDSSIDDEGLGKMLGNLEQMTLDDGNLSINIISHRLQNEYKHFFTSVIEIEQSSDGFSKITKH